MMSVRGGGCLTRIAIPGFKFCFCDDTISIFVGFSEQSLGVSAARRMGCEDTQRGDPVMQRDARSSHQPGKVGETIEVPALELWSRSSRQRQLSKKQRKTVTAQERAFAPAFREEGLSIPCSFLENSILIPVWQQRSNFGSRNTEQRAPTHQLNHLCHCGLCTV